MDTSRLLTIEQARRVLGRAGVELPENTPPQAVFQGLDTLLQGVPDRLVAAAATPGAEVRFGAQAGITVPPLLPANYSHNVAIEGRVNLSGVETGPGLQQTQTFRASVQLQQDDRVALERTLINRIYKYSGSDTVTGALPPGVRDAVQSVRDRVEANPALRAIVRGVPVSIAHTESEGTRLSYEAVVPPALGRRLDAGDTSALPNPLDPLRMPPGSSVLIRGQDLQASSTDLRYKFGMAGESQTRLQGTGFGVRRLEGSMVEVYAGPMNAVEQSVYVGVGLRNANVRLEAENTMEDRRLSVARMDLSTPEGQTAYRQFMDNGQVPDARGPGIPQAGQTTELSIEQARRLGFTLGGGSLSIGSSVNQRITQSNVSGREEIRFDYSRGNLATESTFPMRDGRPDFDAGHYRVVLQGLDANQAGALRATFGGPPGTRALGASQDVQLSLDAQQMLALRDRSREFIASRPHGADLLARIDGRQPLGTELTDPLVRFAGARNAQEVFAAFQDRPQDVPGALYRLNVGVDPAQRRPVPGALEIQPSEEMRAWLAAKPEAERQQIVDRYFRSPATEARQPAPDARTAAEPAVPAPAPVPTTATPTAVPTPAAVPAPAVAPQPLLTDRNHPDHELYVALRAHLPAQATDDQVALATARARDANITADRLTHVGPGLRNPNEIWIGTGREGERASIDLSQPAPPIQQTSQELAVRAQGQEVEQQQQIVQR